MITPSGKLKDIPRGIPIEKLCFTGDFLAIEYALVGHGRRIRCLLWKGDLVMLSRLSSTRGKIMIRIQSRFYGGVVCAEVIVSQPELLTTRRFVFIPYHFKSPLKTRFRPFINCRREVPAVNVFFKDVVKHHLGSRFRIFPCVHVDINRSTIGNKRTQGLVYWLL